MNILVIGGYGFLGLSCAKDLSENHKIFIIDQIKKDCDIDFISEIIDISDSKKIISYIEKNKIDIILHFVSTLLPTSTQEQYFNDYKRVYMPTVTLLDYCATAKVKFVYFSSGGAVYGNQKEIFNEYTKREPISYYGLSKLNFENAINFFHNTKGLEYLIIRPSNPYGPGQNLFGKQGIISVIMGKILNNQSIEIWGDGSAIKDYIYIDDFTFYVKQLIEDDTVWCNVFNVGSGIGSTVNDVIKAFEANNIRLPKINYINSKSSDVKRMLLDCTEIQDRYSHINKTLKEGIQIFWDKIK